MVGAKLVAPEKGEETAPGLSHGELGTETFHLKSFYFGNNLKFMKSCKNETYQERPSLHL